MQKLLSALVAILSFVGMISGSGIGPAAAQDHNAGAGHGASPPSAVAPADTTPLVVRGIMKDNVDVKDRPLIIEGDVKGSVHAVNSPVTLRPGAKVEGKLTLEGGILSAEYARTPVVRAHLAVPVALADRRSARGGDRFGGQFGLWLLGLAAALILMITAPNATSRVSDTLSLRPGKSLVAGLGAAAVMFSALAVSGWIMNTKSFVSAVWTPVLIVVALVSLVALVFGWIAGMRRVGDLIAQRFGHSDRGTFYGRTALGLTAFFLFNAIIGGIIPGLGVVGLLVEFTVAVMGIGALIETRMSRPEPGLGHQFPDLFRS